MIQKIFVIVCVIFVLGVVMVIVQVVDKFFKLVGVIFGDLVNFFFVVIVKGVESGVYKINLDVKVIVVFFKYDFNIQVGQIENFIVNKVDLIVFNVVDFKGVGLVVKKVRKVGIVVVVVDVVVEGVDVIVMLDNIMVGVEFCKFIVDKLQGKGNVVIVNGLLVLVVMDCVIGCKVEFKKLFGIKIFFDNQNVGGSCDGGMIIMFNLLVV